MDGAPARDAAVQHDQQVQRLFDQLPQRHLACALEAGLATLHRGHVAQRDPQLEDVFARDDPLSLWDRRAKAVGEGGLSRLGAARDEDTEAGGDGCLEEPRQGRSE